MVSNNAGIKFVDGRYVVYDGVQGTTTHIVFQKPDTTGRNFYGYLPGNEPLQDDRPEQKPAPPPKNQPAHVQLLRKKAKGKTARW